MKKNLSVLLLLASCLSFLPLAFAATAHTAVADTPLSDSTYIEPKIIPPTEKNFTPITLDSATRMTVVTMLMGWEKKVKSSEAFTNTVELRTQTSITNLWRVNNDKAGISDGSHLSFNITNSYEGAIIEFFAEDSSQLLQMFTLTLINDTQSATLESSISHPGEPLKNNTDFSTIRKFKKLLNIFQRILGNPEII